jgi:hypothetical protein
MMGQLKQPMVAQTILIVLVVVHPELIILKQLLLHAIQPMDSIMKRNQGLQMKENVSDVQNHA